MKLAYFAHDLRDPAVHKRVKSLKRGGAEVELIGFERSGLHAEPMRGTAHRLGRTHNGKFLARACAVIAAVPKAMRLRAMWSGADAILARNLEMLAIVCAAAALLGRKPRLVYECLDIHRLMLGKGMACAALRAIERMCLRRTALVVVSSPAHEASYFRAAQRYAGEILLVENKALAPAPAQPAPAQREAHGPPWRIAWCGVLRCRKSLELLARLAARADAAFEVALRGVPALDQIPDFHAIVEAAPGLAYAGAYKAEDLAGIYEQADFVWTVDYCEEGANSALLLPNRLYEGLRFGAVPLAAAGGVTAHWLAQRGVGVVLNEPLETSLSAFFETCTRERMHALRQELAALPRRDVEMDVEECRAVTARIVGASAKREPVDGLLIVIPCLNEAEHLPGLLARLLQDPGAAQAHIVVVDGGSADASCAIVQDVARADPRVALLHNPRRFQSAAVNLAVERFGADSSLVLRMDAHASYPTDFVAKLVAARAATSADAVAVSLRATGRTSCFARAVAAAQNSRLANGGAPHRARGPRRWIDHGHHALFRKDVFLAAGGYDESFSHNEDAELDARLSERGARILLAADIVVDISVRATPGALFRQYFAYGLGRARTFKRRRAHLKLRQIAPLLVVPAVLALALAPFAPWAAAPFAAWLTACLSCGLALGARERNLCACAAGLAAVIMHLAWSLGFWSQVLSGRDVSRSARQAHS